MTSKQRAYLRSLANTLEPIFQIGKSGISENLIQQLSDALDARELIKIHVLETAPDTAKNLGIEISNLTNSTLVQTIGNKITLFKQKEKNSKFYSISNSNCNIYIGNNIFSANNEKHINKRRPVSV